MYVYFDNLGNLKEIVNDKVFRVGNSNYNEIYVYIDKQNYDNVSGITTTYYLPDGDKSVEAYTINIVETQLPYSKKRDLKFFEYFKTYKSLMKKRVTLSSAFLGNYLKVIDNDILKC